MSAIEIATKVIKANADVKALVANRIFPIQAPQKVDGPFLVINQISGVDTSLINSPGEYYRDRVSVDICSQSGDEVNDIGALIRLVLPRIIKQTIGKFHDVDISFADVDMTQPDDVRTAYMRTLHFFIRWRY